MIYIGLDVHKNGSVYCCQNESGQVIRTGNLKNTAQSIGKMLLGMGVEVQVAIEATGSWQHVASILQSQGAKVILSHPRRTRAIAEAKVKTDAIDARTLCDLMRVGLLPQAYMPPPPVHELRRLVRTRTHLVESRTRAKNQIHGLLTQHGMIFTQSDLFGKQGRRWLSQLGLGFTDSLIITSLLSQIDSLNTAIKSLEGELKRLLGHDPAYKALGEIPGFGPISRAAFLAEVGDVSRFKRARHLLSYLGIVPRVRASGGRTRFGRLTKEGPPLVRNMLVQAAYPAVRKDPDLKALYSRTKERHGSQVGRIAVARKLATRAFHKLREVQSPLLTSG